MSISIVKPIHCTFSQQLEVKLTSDLLSGFGNPYVDLPACCYSERALLRQQSIGFEVHFQYSPNLEFYCVGEKRVEVAE